MIFAPSPFEKRIFRGREIYIKRDDVLHVDFSGNKARKFHWFLNQKFLNVKRVVSYGSNQSNAMYSLSVMARIRGWEFIYFCNQIPSFLKENPVGNYKYALENGMKILESEHRQEDAYTYTAKSDLIIEEGGRQKEAEFGVKILAEELKRDIEKEGIKNPYIYLPSGTGTTALFLQKNLPFRVFTCSTVGNDEYLKEQFEEIEEDNFPVILSSQKKYHYGKLYRELYNLWLELQKNMDITFDLMYDPVGWKKFLLHIDEIEGTPIYIHQGGVIGNESMLERYKRKYETDKY